MKIQIALILIILLTACTAENSAKKVKSSFYTPKDGIPELETFQSMIFKRAVPRGALLGSSADVFKITVHKDGTINRIIPSPRIKRRGVFGTYIGKGDRFTYILMPPKLTKRVIQMAKKWKFNTDEKRIFECIISLRETEAPDERGSYYNWFVCGKNYPLSYKQLITSR